MHLNDYWDLTVVLSTSSCNEAISLSPTGFQPFRTFSASLKSASRSSMEHCRSFSFSRAWSICFCQPLAQIFRLSHFSFTSADCLRIALAIFCAFSSGVNSENGKNDQWNEQGFIACGQEILLLSKYTCCQG